MIEERAEFTREHQDLVIAHYELVAPLVTATFAGTPLIAGFVHDWSTKVVTYEASLTDVPASIPTVQVQLRRGESTFVAVAEKSLMWQAHRGALSFFGWSPTRSDPARAAFARILLAPSGLATMEMVKESALMIRSVLAKYEMRAALLLTGDGGLALWIPFSGSPNYEALRSRLHALSVEAATAHPELLTVAGPVADRGDRVHIATGSNAVGRCSEFPYTLRALEALPVAAPIAWDELAAIESGGITVTNLAARISAKGDVFASEIAAIGTQSSAAFFASAITAPPSSMFVSLASDGEPRGRIIRAAIAILDDGKPRDADALCAEAIVRGLIPKTTTRKDVYTELIEYISRAKGHDRTPKLVQDPDRRFRRNLPADDWPAPKTPLPVCPAAANADSIIADLRSTGMGDDPAAYEVAVCAAFAALGFVTTHVGGPAAPDGYLDAPLGTLGYRVMLECKRASTIVQEPDAAEAAKYVTPYHAQLAILVGPSFGADIQLASELQTHGVAAFTNDDLAQLLTAGVGPIEMHPIFSPGFAADRIEARLWERDHGARKRLAVACEIIASAGWQNQIAAAKTGDPLDFPRLNEDAAMMLVDEEILGREGSQQPCGREVVGAAFAYLTNILVGAATWTDETKDAIVIARSPTQ